jgi:hypothetical protein
MKIWRWIFRGIEFFAMLLVAMILIFSLVPAHAQAPDIILEHRLTINEQGIATLAQGLTDVRSQVAGIETKVMYVISGIALLLIKAAVNIFMATFFPNSKPV